MQRFSQIAQRFGLPGLSPLEMKLKGTAKSGCATKTGRLGEKRESDMVNETRWLEIQLSQKCGQIRIIDN